MNFHIAIFWKSRRELQAIFFSLIICFISSLSSALYSYITQTIYNSSRWGMTNFFCCFGLARKKNQFPQSQNKSPITVYLEYLKQPSQKPPILCCRCRALKNSCLSVCFYTFFASFAWKYLCLIHHFNKILPLKSCLFLQSKKPHFQPSVTSFLNYVGKANDFVIALSCWSIDWLS